MKGVVSTNFTQEFSASPLKRATICHLASLDSLRPQSATTRSSPHEPSTVDARIPSTAMSCPAPESQWSVRRGRDLIDEDKCFYCKEAGHLSRECPVKNFSAELKVLTLYCLLKQNMCDLGLSRSVSK